MESDFDGETPNQVVDAVLLLEGLDPTTVDRRQRDQILAVVIDWLFDPEGRGELSGLPR